MKSENYSGEYSEKNFWEKLKRHAKAAGAEAVEKILCMHEALKDPDTPAWAKTVIVGALGYFIMPLDAIPDITPMVGFTDDLGAIAAATALVATPIKDEHVTRAKASMDRWFGKKTAR